jgi:hypothetical protein
MTNEHLQEAKKLEAYISFHNKYYEELLKKVSSMQESIKYFKSEGLTSYDTEAAIELKPAENKTEVKISSIRILNSSQLGVGYLDFRPKALIEYVKIEAQYHFQKAEEYKRKLNRL